jgi:sulfite exporter TauE/SafE
MLYNLGRISMYGILGAVTAVLGYALPLSAYQNLFSVILGSSLILMALLGVTGTRIPVVTNALVRFTGLLRAAFSKYIGRKGAGTMLFLGALNGLLPCGLTFLALSFCITLTTPTEGFAYMFTFGVGTLPVMLGLVSIADIMKNKIHWDINRVTTGLMMLSGILLIARVFLIHLPDGHAHEFNLVDIVICR